MVFFNNERWVLDLKMDGIKYRAENEENCLEPVKKNSELKRGSTSKRIMSLNIHPEPQWNGLE